MSSTLLTLTHPTIFHSPLSDWSGPLRPLCAAALCWERRKAAERGGNVAGFVGLRLPTSWFSVEAAFVGLSPNRRICLRVPRADPPTSAWSPGLKARAPGCSLHIWLRFQSEPAAGLTPGLLHAGHVSDDLKTWRFHRFLSEVLQFWSAAKVLEQSLTSDSSVAFLSAASRSRWFWEQRRSGRSVQHWSPACSRSSLQPCTSARPMRKVC